MDWDPKLISRGVLSGNGYKRWRRRPKVRVFDAALFLLPNVACGVNNIHDPTGKYFLAVTPFA
jgi:hypothetical protein